MMSNAHGRKHMHMNNGRSLKPCALDDPERIRINTVYNKLLELNRRTALTRPARVAKIMGVVELVLRQICPSRLCKCATGGR